MFNIHALPVRRRFLKDAGLGFGSLALASLLQEEAMAASPVADMQGFVKSEIVRWGRVVQQAGIAGSE